MCVRTIPMIKLSHENTRNKKKTAESTCTGGGRRGMAHRSDRTKNLREN